MAVHEGIICWQMRSEDRAVLCFTDDPTMHGLSGPPRTPIRVPLPR